MSYALAIRLRRPVVFALSLALLVGPSTPAVAQGNCSGVKLGGSGLPLATLSQRVMREFRVERTSGQQRM